MLFYYFTYTCQIILLNIKQILLNNIKLFEQSYHRILAHFLPNFRVNTINKFKKTIEKKKTILLYFSHIRHQRM